MSLSASPPERILDAHVQVTPSPTSEIMVGFAAYFASDLNVTEQGMFTPEAWFLSPSYLPFGVSGWLRSIHSSFLLPQPTLFSVHGLALMLPSPEVEIWRGST